MYKILFGQDTKYKVGFYTKFRKGTGSILTHWHTPVVSILQCAFDIYADISDNFLIAENDPDTLLF